MGRILCHLVMWPTLGARILSSGVTVKLLFPARKSEPSSRWINPKTSQMALRMMMIRYGVLTFSWFSQASEMSHWAGLSCFLQSCSPRDVNLGPSANPQWVHPSKPLFANMDRNLGCRLVTLSQMYQFYIHIVNGQKEKASPPVFFF